MAFSMKSKTKVNVTMNDISNIITYHFKEEVLESKEIVSGFYNAIYYVKISSSELVLKVAPSEDISILTYERDIIKREVKVYEIMKSLGVPVPKVYVSDYSKSVIDSDYYIMNYIEGSTLFELRDSGIDKEKIYFQLMKYLSQIHSQKMDFFGYDNFDKKPRSIKEAYFLMLDNLLNDANRANLELPSYVHDLISMVKRLEGKLSYNNKPSLLHFDLWDGNIFIQDENIVGLIDTERSMNFEPMMEFVAMHIDIFNEDNVKYVDYYNQFAIEKINLNEESLIRFRMYQVYMYLLIVVECPYRDIEGSFNDQKNWGLNELKNIYTYFSTML